MKRFFDFVIAFLLIGLLILPILFIAISVRLSSKGPIIYWSNRVGQSNIIFKMPKFRTMHVDSPTIASHLVEDANSFITPIGSLLRRFSLDEIPQLFSIIKGDMSFVGPRPALFNQYDLVALREEKGVDKLIPGITGWAQINGRDKLSIFEKVDLDLEYLNQQSFIFDLKIILKTVLKVILQDNISH